MCVLKMVAYSSCTVLSDEGKVELIVIVIPSSVRRIVQLHIVHK